MIGDSIVARAGSDNNQLHGGGQTIWKGLSGAKCVAVVNRLSRYLYRTPAPTTLIIHLGTNDIFKATTREIRDRVETNLKAVRALLPFCRIIWSDIIVRLAYAEEKVKGAGKRCVRSINKKAHKVCRRELLGNANVITYSDILSPEFRNIDGPVYTWDCTHPSEYGLLRLRQRLSNALSYFNAHPQAFSYPPGSADE